MGRVSLLHYFYFVLAIPLIIISVLKNEKFMKLTSRNNLCLSLHKEFVTSTLKWMRDYFCQNNKQCRLKKYEFFF